MLQPNISAFRRHSRQLVRELGLFRRHYADTGVTSAQAHLLIDLGDSPGRSLTDLVARVQMEKSAASRTVKRLVERGEVAEAAHRGDQREKRFVLTEAGRRTLAQIHRRAEASVRAAFDNLTPREQAAVCEGVRAYAGALARARQQRGIRVRPIEPHDEAELAEVIVRVLELEYGETRAQLDEEFAEYRTLYTCFAGEHSAYFVIEAEGAVQGGGGIVPLNAGDAKVCTLQKMYCLPELRGKGLGRVIVNRCLEFATRAGFSACYLETRADMHAARRLYERMGFVRLDAPMGPSFSTCDVFYIKELARG